MRTECRLNDIRFVSLFQIFAVDEESIRLKANLQDGDDLEKSSETQRFAVVAQRRLAIAKLLLKAGTNPGDTALNRDYTVYSLAEKNPNSGGPEILDLLTDCAAEPRSLLSSCRLAVRRSLSRPILLHGNVKALPITESVKQYVAMDQCSL